MVFRCDLNSDLRLLKHSLLFIKKQLTVLKYKKLAKNQGDLFTLKTIATIKHLSSKLTPFQIKTGRHWKVLKARLTKKQSIFIKGSPL